MTLFESEDNKYYDYNMLVYPNITFKKNLEKDSYVVVIKKVIDYLNDNYGNIYFTLVLPEYVKCLDLKNTRQVYYNVPNFPNSMRCHFDVFKFMEIIDWRHNDYDFVYTNLPEHTLQLSNIFNNSTNMSPRFFGYCHWFETKDSVGFGKKMFNQNIIGLLEMEKCGVNSDWLKQYVISEAEKTFSKETINKLDSILEPCYLGCDYIDLSESNKIPKSVVFNHREGEYTGFKKFISVMDKIYETRKDFKVYLTMSSCNRPYIENVSISSREEYLKFMKSMSFGVGYFQKYSAWSVSVTDGLSLGIPYILPNNFCYPEMVGDYPLLYNNETEFIDLFKKMLDNPKVDYTNTIKPWNDRIADWHNGWQFLKEEQPTVKETESYLKLVNFIKKNKSVTKFELMKHIGWGVGIPFTRYRNRLRMEKGIKLTSTGYEYVV